MMNTKRTLSTSLSMLALLAAFGSAAHAAPAPQHWIPAGEAIGDENVAPSTASNTTRAEVAADTRQARRAGELQAAGEASGEHQQHEDQSRPSTVARAAVKAETLAAVRNGTIAPFGEAATFGATYGGE
jgi:hypothetical protein